jgi:predicted ATPase
MLERNTRRVAELSDRLAAVRSAYETFKGSREGTIYHDWALLHSHAEATLLDRMQASIEQLDATKNWALLPFFIVSVAELRAKHGDSAAAAALLDRAAELVAITGEQWCQPEILRLQAGLTEDAGEAAHVLQESLAKAREQSARLWELRSATDLAQLWRDQGRQDEARELLAPVYQWFSEGLQTPDLVAARGLLEELGARRKLSVG